MLSVLTDKLWQEYNRPEVLIQRIASLVNTYTIQQRKEVTALDADVPLLRSSLRRFDVSGLRMFKFQADRLNACHLGWLRAV